MRIVLVNMRITWYGSQLEAGRRSSKKPWNEYPKMEWKERKKNLLQLVFRMVSLSVLAPSALLLFFRILWVWFTSSVREKDCRNVEKYYKKSTFLAKATGRGIRTEAPLLATPHENWSWREVSWRPVIRRRLSVPSCGSYTLMWSWNDFCGNFGHSRERVKRSFFSESKNNRKPRKFLRKFRKPKFHQK